MLASLRVDEQESCLASPSYLVLAGILGFLVILVSLGFIDVLISYPLVCKPTNAASRSLHDHFLNEKEIFVLQS